MDARLPAIAQQLLLIERELRALGWWMAEPPSDEALASQEPFCVDTLSFEAWLQWVFLRRMKELVESAGALPRASGIKPMAEQVYVGQEAKVLALLDVLGEFDRLIGETG